MSSNYKIYITLFLFFIGSISSPAQSTSFLDYFSAFIDNKQISLNWTITGGNTCNGIKIYRSTDTISFTEIGFISGICGNSSTPVSYNFTDSNPVPNQVNFYRLELGTLGFTEHISIEYLNFNNKGYQVRPNPIRDATTIYFSNALQKEYTFKLFDSSGKKILSIENIYSDSFTFRRDNISDGIYVFTLESKSEDSFTGKIIMQ